MKISVLVMELILEAYQLHASDIHFQASETDVKILFRIKTDLSVQRVIDPLSYQKI